MEGGANNRDLPHVPHAPLDRTFSCIPHNLDCEGKFTDSFAPFLKWQSVCLRHASQDLLDAWEAGNAGKAAHLSSRRDDLMVERLQAQVDHLAEDNRLMHMVAPQPSLALPEKTW